MTGMHYSDHYRTLNFFIISVSPKTAILRLSGFLENKDLRNIKIAESLRVVSYRMTGTRARKTQRAFFRGIIGTFVRLSWS